MELYLKSRTKIIQKKTCTLQCFKPDSWIFMHKARNAHWSNLINILFELFFTCVRNHSKESKAHTFFFPVLAFYSSFKQLSRTSQSSFFSKIWGHSLESISSYWSWIIFCLEFSVFSFHPSFKVVFMFKLSHHICYCREKFIFQIILMLS